MLQMKPCHSVSKTGLATQLLHLGNVPEQLLGITFALQDLMMTDSVEGWTHPSLQDYFFLQKDEVLSSKKREENSVKIRKFVKESWNSGTVKFLLFLLPMTTFVTDTLTAYMYLHTNLCSGNSVCMLATCPQQICPTFTKPKESNKSMDLHPTEKGVLHFSYHRPLAIATHFLTFSVSSQEEDTVAGQSNYQIAK